MSTTLRTVTNLLNSNKKRRTISKDSASDQKTSQSYESFSNPDFVITGDAAFAQECYDIVSTHTSVEELDRLFMNQHNDLALSVEMLNSEIKKYYDNRRLTKEFIHKFKSTHSNTMEAASSMIDIMSLESVGSFMSKSWEAIKQFFKKLITQAMKLIKMFTTFVRGKMAASQNSLYTKLSGEIGNHIKRNGANTAVYKMYNKSAITNIPNMTNKLISAANQFESDINKTFNSGGAKNALKNIFGGEKSVPAAIGQINKILGNGGNSENTRAAVNKIFFGTEKQPKASEHKINELLTPDSFKAASKEWLAGLQNLTKAANNMTKQCNKVIKKIESFEKGIIKDKEGSDSAKEEARAVMASVSGIRMKMQVYQMYIRDYFWTALDYRTTICSLAKKVSGMSKAADKETAKNEKAAAKQAQKDQKAADKTAKKEAKAQAKANKK